MPSPLPEILRAHALEHRAMRDSGLHGLGVIEMSRARARLPGPHLVPRMQYRFPQMVSQGPGLRPTSKRPGCQGCDQGQGATATPMQMVSGLAGLRRLGQATLGDTHGEPLRIPWYWYTISTVSMAASAYHGYRRNNSLGWALWWGFMGSLFPIFTPVIAVAQGYGKRKR